MLQNIPIFQHKLWIPKIINISQTILVDSSPSTLLQQIKVNNFNFSISQTKSTSLAQCHLVDSAQKFSALLTLQNGTVQDVLLSIFLCTGTSCYSSNRCPCGFPKNSFIYWLIAEWRWILYLDIMQGIIKTMDMFQLPLILVH